MIWLIFWSGFWADLLRPEPPAPNVISFDDWRRSHPGPKRAA